MYLYFVLYFIKSLCLYMYYGVQINSVLSHSFAPDFYFKLNISPLYDSFKKEHFFMYKNFLYDYMIDIISKVSCVQDS